VAEFWTLGGKRTMKAQATKFSLLLSLVVLTGCLSMNPERAQRTVSHWIPLGTPQEDAFRIMERHGFTSQVDQERQNKGETAFWFYRETKILRNNWVLEIEFKNGKVISIDRPNTFNDFMGHFEKLEPSGG
jgi:hypothetical protein